MSNVSPRGAKYWRSLSFFRRVVEDFARKKTRDRQKITKKGRICIFDTPLPWTSAKRRLTSPPQTRHTPLRHHRWLSWGAKRMKMNRKRRRMYVLGCHDDDHWTKKCCHIRHKPERSPLPIRRSAGRYAPVWRLSPRLQRAGWGAI